MKYFYQRLEASDVELLKQLRQVFAVAFEEEEIWKVKPPSDSYLAEVLENKNYIALVARDEDGRVIGGLVAHVLSKIDQERSELYLYDLAVLSENRRQGVATKLIETLKEAGREVGAYVIFVQADNVDTPAVTLYSKMASEIESDITHFDIPID